VASISALAGEAMSDYMTEAPPAPRRAIRLNVPRARGEAVYRSARRHSWWVRWLKIVLPVLAVIGVLGFFAVTNLATLLGNGTVSSVSLEGINIESKSLVMNKPRISGFDGTKRAYEMVAARAIQDIKDPKVVTLQEITAKFAVNETATATLEADTGVFNANHNTLALSGGIKVKTSDGVTAKFEAVAIDIGKGNLSSTKPVEVSSADGTLHANAMEVTDRGKTIVFTNGVSVTFVPPDAPAKSGTPAARGAAPASDKSSPPATPPSPAPAEATQ
jgi:lipopolysaccharide export system protein LptC